MDNKIFQKEKKKAIRSMARRIRKAALEVAKPKNYATKTIFVFRSFSNEISVTDDSGYRSILIGDAESPEYGYCLLYSENEREYGDFGTFRMFPLVKDIEHALTVILDGGNDALDIPCFGGFHGYASTTEAMKKTQSVLARFLLDEMDAVS